MSLWSESTFTYLLGLYSTFFSKLMESTDVRFISHPYFVQSYNPASSLVFPTITLWGILGWEKMTDSDAKSCLELGILCCSLNCTMLLYNYYLFLGSHQKATSNYPVFVLLRSIHIASVYCVFSFFFFAALSCTEERNTVTHNGQTCFFWSCDWS